MAGFGIGQKSAECRGIDLAHPVDRTAPGKFPYLENVVAVIDGSFSPRPGAGSAAVNSGIAAKTPWHSARTLSDPSAGGGVWSRIYGIADRLGIERSATAGTTADAGGGWSGNPLSMLQLRPPESPQPWMFVADSAQMRKIRQDGTLHQIGLPAPSAAPEAIVTTGFFKAADLLRATTGWSADGTYAAAPTLLSAGTGRPVSTTVTGFRQEFGYGGQTLTCIQPASMANIVTGCILAVDGVSLAAEDVLVTDTKRGSAETTAAHILYETAPTNTGLCSIHLASALPELEVNSLVLITGVATAGSELARVRDVESAADGSQSIRVSTTVERKATDKVQAVASFVCHMLDGVSAGGNVRSDGLHTTVAATPSGSSGYLTKTVALDFSQMVGGAPTDGDFMSVVLRCNEPDKLTEVRFLLDFDAATNDFTRNYYWRAITASDLTPALKFAQTALVNRQDQIQKRQLILGPGGRPITGGLRSGGVSESGGIGSRVSAGGFDSPSGIDISDSGNLPADQTSPRDQLTPGDSQYSQVRFRLSEFQRVGTADSRGWKDIAAIRITFQSTVSVDVDIVAWSLHGSLEPEVSDDSQPGYEYRYRGRVSATGVVSNFSPASRGPIRPVRQAVSLTAPQHPSAECDKLDWERYGGPVPGWHQIATTDNVASPAMQDRISNDAALAVEASPDDGADSYQLWPILGKPVSGTATTVAGTLVFDNSAPFSTAWAPGTEVKVYTASSAVAGLQSSIRRVISTKLIELYDSVGGGSAVKWEIPAPLILGQPLPVMIEWKSEHRIIGLGDPNNPSAFYVSKPDDYDSTLGGLQYEIPGEILISGCYYNGSPYIWSSERQYRIESLGFGPLGEYQVRAVEVPGSRGLAARWAWAVGDRGMYWLSKDGICTASGGYAELITADLYPLFPHAGVPGVATNGLQPPDLSASQEPHTRLAYGDGSLWLGYNDALSARRWLEYRIRGSAELSGWYPHVFPAALGGIESVYFDEGPGRHAMYLLGGDATRAKLYQLTDRQSDAGAAVAWLAVPQVENVGDPRKRKRWGDYTTEIDFDGGVVTILPEFDNRTIAGVSASPTGAAGTRIITIGKIGSPAGLGLLATNMDVRFSGSATTDRPRVYYWEPTWLDRPEVTRERATDFEDAGSPGCKLVRGIRIHCDTFGVIRSADVHKDGDSSVIVTTLTPISAAGPTWLLLPIEQPFYAYTLQLAPADSSEWQLFGWEWVFDPAPDKAANPQEWSDLGYAGAKFLQGVVIDQDTEGDLVDIRVEVDENQLGYLIPTTRHSGRAQKQYDFNPPFITHLVRPNPVQPTRLWPTPPVRWIWEPEPELARHWEGQQTTFDIQEPYKVGRDMLLTIRSYAAVTVSFLRAETGVVAWSAVIPSTGGLRRPVYLSASVLKGRAFIPIADSAAPFALYRRDTWLRVRGWSEREWRRVMPFGDDHRLSGARV